MRPLRRVALSCLSAGLLLLAWPVHAQPIRACWPTPLTDVLGPSPFPDPYPDDHPARRARPVARVLGARSLPGLGEPRHALARRSEAPCAVEEQTRPWDGTDWAAPRLQTTAAYDGVRLAVVEDGEDTGAGLMPTWRSTYNRNVPGRLTSVVRERFVDGAFALASRVTFGYDAQLRLSTITQQVRVGNGWRNATRTTIGYGSGPHAASLLFEAWGEGAWEFAERILYGYDSAGFPTTRVASSWDGSGWALAYRESFVYPAPGRLGRYLLEDPDGSGWVPVQQTVFGYDADARLLDDEVQEWDGSVWTPFLRTDYAYTADGRLADATHAAVLPGGSGLDPVAREQFAYDAEGRLAAVTYEAPDGAGWTPGERDLLTRQGGRLSARETQAYDGEQWMPVEQRRLAYGGVVAEGPGAAGSIAWLTAGPSPASQTVAVHLGLGTPGHVTVRVIDALGREVVRLADGEHLGGRHVWRVDVSRVAVGVYVVEAVTGDARLARRVVVVR